MSYIKLDKIQLYTGVKLYKFWKERPPSKKRVIIEATGPFWGPFVLAGGVLETTVGLVGYISLLLTHSFIELNSDAADRNNNNCCKNPVEKTIWITMDGILLMAAGICITFGGIPAAVYDGCSSEENTEEEMQLLIQ